MRKSYREECWISPRVEQRSSATHGLGLFAKEPINQGETVIVWGGNFVHGKEAEEARQRGLAIQQIDEDLYDVFDYETRNDDPSYNHNHSCDPNTWMEDEVTISARRDIAQGEELTIDYALFIIDDDWVMPGECACGTPLCRHKITGKDWKQKDLQERYKGHFSPYLNKKIGFVV